MIRLFGTVQRLVWSDGVPATEWRTRDTALFPEQEWDWSRDGDQAYVFPMYDRPAVSGPDDYARSAAVHVAALKAAGEKSFVCASVHGQLAQAARAQRSANAAASALASAEDLQGDDDAAPVEEAPASSVEVRPGDKIQARIRQARTRGNGRGSRVVDPAEVFAREERRHLA